MKKILSVFLSICVIISCFVGMSVTAGASSSWASGACTVTLSDDWQTLTVSGNGAMADYFNTNIPWYDYLDSIKTITIENGVTYIGNSAFSWLREVVNVTIPNSVTSIGSEAFNMCQSLISLSIPESVTSIGGYAFLNCNQLTTVNIPSRVTIINDGTFSVCESLGSITIPSNVTSIGDRAFAHCKSLQSISIPGKVRSIGDYSFYRCTNLQSISIPNSVTSIGGCAFQECTSLQNISIPNSVTSIGGGAFQNCANLQSISIPSRVTVIGDSTFYGCKNLASVSIPSRITSIGSNAFFNCQSLTSLNIPASVTIIRVDPFGYHAFDRSGLTTINYGSSKADWANVAGNDTIPANCDVYYSINGCTATAIPDQLYTGAAITPEVEIKDGDTVLVKGTDYSVTYSNNTAVGTATITITGCEGSDYANTTKIVTFRIKCNHHFVDGKCTICGVADPDYVPPGASGIPIPLNFRATAVQDANGNVLLKWPKFAYADSYTVLMTVGGVEKVIKPTKNESLIVKGLKSGVKYSFKVRYNIGAWTSPDELSAKTTVTPNYKPVSTAKTTDAGVELSWTKVPNATSYQICKFVNGKLKTLGETSGTKALISGADGGTFAVRAVVNGEKTKVKRSDLVTAE